MNEVNPPGSSTPRDKGVTSSYIEPNKGVSFEEQNADLKLTEDQVVTQVAESEKVTPLDVTEEKLESAVSQLNEFLQSSERDLLFSLDEGSGKTVVTVLDKETQVVIRQFPGDVVLKLAQDLTEEEPLYMFSAEV